MIESVPTRTANGRHEKRGFFLPTWVRLGAGRIDELIERTHRHASVIASKLLRPASGYARIKVIFPPHVTIIRDSVFITLNACPRVQFGAVFFEAVFRFKKKNGRYERNFFKCLAKFLRNLLHSSQVFSSFFFNCCFN